ncbi:MAG: hypothetical protein WD844_14305 [Thermoleophilaceae bacterium]
MTIVEAVIASSILLVAMLGGFLAIESASSATKTAERQAIAAAAGEEEVERLAGLDFDELTHCQSAAPSHNSDPGAPAGQVPENPEYHVVNSTPRRFSVLADYRSATSAALPGTEGGEVLAVAASNCALTAPSVPFTSGVVTGDVWRFVTIREDSCPPSLPALTAPLNGLLSGLLNIVAGLLGGLTDAVGNGVNLFCTQPQDSKRITVAVVVDDASTLGPRKPTWMSTIVTNDNDGLVLDESSRLDF